jgi:hypothetical protein
MGIKISPKDKRRQRNKAVGWFFIILICGVIIGVGGYSLNKIIKKQDIDEETNCPSEGITKHSAILIDTTDNYTPVQKKWIKNQLEEIIKATEKHEKVSVYTINENYEGALLPLKSQCNPGDASDINPLTGNKKMTKINWDNEFIKPLHGEFDELLNKKESSQSPIMEIIQAISIAAFQSETSSVRKKLFVFSDMIQNTSNVSHYKDSLKFKEFRNSPEYFKVRTDLQDVVVKIFYMRRTGAEEIQKGTALAQFWAKYFKSMDAVIDSIKSGEG